MSIEFVPKNIIFDDEVIVKLVTGAEKAYKAVSATYGIGGHFVGFESSNSVYPKFTKDGVSVARQIVLPAPAENIGALLLIQAANKQVEQTGDGTTLTVVLAYEIIKAGLKAISMGINPAILRSEITNTLSIIIKKLIELSIPSSPELLRNVATIAANNNEALGTIIANAVTDVGKYGVVTHDRSKTGKTYVQYSDGYSFDNGIKWREFVTNAQTQTLEIENPLILVSDKQIAHGNHINKISKIANKRSLIIINDNYQEDCEAHVAVLASFKEGHRIYNIKTNIGDPMRRKYALEDIAALCNTEVYRGEWVSIADSNFGNCTKVVSSFSKTTITGTQVDRRVNELKASLSNVDSEYEIDLIKESIAKLSNGVATIFVGGATEVEHKELADRVDDAIRACVSAQEEGVVDGGGVALINVLKTFLKDTEGFTLSSGDRIFFEVLQKPIQKILSNANMKSDLIVEKILKDEAHGYNINTGLSTKESMIVSHVIDPLKVVRTALINATSVASIMLQTNVLITAQKD